MEFPGEPAAVEDLSLDEIRLRFGEGALWAEVVRRGRRMPRELQVKVREMAGCCAELAEFRAHCIRPLGHAGPHRGPGAPPVEGAGLEAQEQGDGLGYVWTDELAIDWPFVRTPDEAVASAWAAPFEGFVWVEERVTVKHADVEKPLAVEDYRAPRRQRVPLDTWAARQEQARRARGGR